jgi:hypothetical protein
MTHRDGFPRLSARSARVVKIFKEYNETMNKAGPPYRF